MGKKNVTGFRQYGETAGGHDCSDRGGWIVIEVGATLASAAKYLAMLRVMKPACKTTLSRKLFFQNGRKRHYLVSRHLLLLVVTGWPRRGSRRHLNRCQRRNTVVTLTGSHEAIQQASHNASTFPFAGVIEYHRRRAAGSLRSSRSSLAATFERIRGEHEAMRM